MTGAVPSATRRSLLKGGLAAGAVAGFAGCGYVPSKTKPTESPLPKSAKSRVDGDLVYFNWADYLDPGVLKGFQEEYGVKIIESNYDSMEGMYAKIAAGNQYDIVFPIAKWVVKLRQEGKLPPSIPPSWTTPTRSSTPARTSTTPGTTRARRSRCPSPSTRPGSAGGPTRCRR